MLVTLHTFGGRIGATGLGGAHIRGEPGAVDGMLPKVTDGGPVEGWLPGWLPPSTSCCSAFKSLPNEGRCVIAGGGRSTSWWRGMVLLTRPLGPLPARLGDEGAVFEFEAAAARRLIMASFRSDAGGQNPPKSCIGRGDGLGWWMGML